MPMVRFRCSYGGRIIPGSHEKSSHYIGGVTRVVFIERVSSLSDFRTLLFKALFPGTLIDGCCLSIKYLLPGKDPDRLISVTTDQDLHEMYQANSKLQLFLFLLDEDGDEYDLEWNECVSDTGMEDDMEYDMEDDMKEYEQKELERGQKEEKVGLRLPSSSDETNVIKSIVRSTAKHTLYTSSKVYKGFVGMDSRIDDLLHNYICPWLGDEVRTIGIHGMRGIGKTTVARAVYDHICQNFEHTCFLSNVREMSKRDGLISLQEKLLSRILMEKIRNIEDEYNGAAMIERRLCKIRVLVVMDDVDQLIQLENLAGSRDWFGPGSRILITTPDVHLLKAHGVDTIYSATGLNCDEALQLLSLKAFKKSCPPEDYLELCHHILGYAQGLPLALAIIGSFLFGRSTNEWKSAIDRLKNKPERNIVDVLRISFDGLRETEKEIFLHIACFYKGKDRDRVTEILDYCQLYPVIGLSVLADKSLIAMSKNKLVMHDMLQEMGWEIVLRESPYNPGKRSRLWSHEDINSVLKKNKLNDFQGFNNIAYAMLEAFVHQGITKARETFQIVSPGSNIPKWFRHRRVGDSLTVPLPSHSNNNRFIGFALCAVFVLHEHHRVDELNIYQFKTFNATHHLVCCLKLNGRKLEVRGRQPAFRFSEEFCQIESDHLWLFYVSCDKYFGREWQNSRSKIEFLFQTRGPGLKVKKCGVHFIYGQDVGGLNLTMTQPSRWIAPHEHLIDFQKI
ncbi:hypothetical protein M0R45_025595 [Rubus argutus]|uniref:ADP-ribosyl cyclase/cyclic ADP-ribose hydrolase n=1 Tax=Rubus argutus TaxID=59490 RepID=A0AAW1WV38_RUBAR